MRLRSFLLAAGLTGLGCAGTHQAQRPSSTTRAPDRVRLDALETELVGKYGEAVRARLHRGIEQVAALWRPADGDLAAFVRAQFIADPQKRLEAFAHLERTFEQLDGHTLEMGRAVRWYTDVDTGPLLPVDALLGGLDPSAHLTDDLFDSKVGFVALLNFPLTTLEEREANAKRYSRQEWAELRLAGRFQLRIPAEVNQQIAKAGADADLYISNYNIWMHHLVDGQGKRLFPKGMRLISHWNLRDELKADYADPKDGLAKQRMVIKVMERIVTQKIPAAVIDNPHLDWDPFTNQVRPTPPAELEADAPARDTAPSSAPEPDTRYRMLLANFRAAKEADRYAPSAPTAIARSFEISRELPEARVVAMLKQVLESPLVPKVAALIQKRLGRPLEPIDLWYDGFKARASIPEEKLDAICRQRYPTAAAFRDGLPDLLQRLGFTKEKATFLAQHIEVDPSRGAGHAMQAARRGDLPHLRTRVEPGGMNYKGFNIAVHELGHNVEQVFSLYEVDHTLLAGVPNSAFTEALAFLFQNRDLELLGMQPEGEEAQALGALSDFWGAWEIAGVALVDDATWHWMYAHPEATPAELRDAVVQISRDTWNRYYAPVLGGKDEVLLGVYSHMISYPLYLADYPLGHMIARQLAVHFATQPQFGAEYERVARFGSVTPDLWMEHATGAKVGPEALLQSAEAALAVVR